MLAERSGLNRRLDHGSTYTACRPVLDDPVALEHVSLPVRLPDLSHLTNDELQALRHRISLMTRDARKKATNIINRIPSVQKPWMRTLSLKPDDPTRQESFAKLELELLRHPEAFLAHAYVNSLFVLDEGLRAEMGRRSLLPTRGKNKFVPTPLPKEAGDDVLSAIQAIEDADD